MTTISPDTSLGLAKTQSPLVRLVIGAKLIADVIGPTRSGLSVRIGHEPHLLQMKGEFSAARNLTLQVTDVKNDVDYKVQILASNDQPLPKPVPAELTSRPSIPAVQPASVTMKEDSPIDVTAQPIARDGKASGSPVMIRLATLPKQVATPDHGQHSKDERPAHEPIIAKNGKPTMGANASAPVSSPAAPTVRPAVDHGIMRSTPALPTTDEAVSAPSGDGKAASSGGTSAASKGGAGVISSGELRPAPSGETKAAPALPHEPSQLKMGSVSRMTVPPQAAIPALDTGRTMTATVVGQVPGRGQILLQTSELLMKIEQPVDLPVGTALQMTLLTQPMPYGAQFDDSAPVDDGNLLTKLIELLDDIEQPGYKPQEAGGPAVPRQLPMPDRGLAAKLLQFINLQTGQNLGEVGISTDDQDGVSMSKMNQVRALLSEIGGSAAEPLADGWRSITLPLGPDPAQAVMMFHREHRLDQDSDQADEEVGDAAAQRAIFDINFSRLGRCQIDVLCQQQRFDLLVRSEKLLDAANQQEITNLFSSACEIAGLSGDIGYRHGQFVEPEKVAMSTTTVTT